jgi:hypothetical protein
VFPVRYELNTYIHVLFIYRPTQYICVFRMVLTVNSDCFPKHHYPVWLCSGEVMCFLWGTNLILIYYLDEDPHSVSVRSVWFSQ